MNARNASNRRNIDYVPSSGTNALHAQKLTADCAVAYIDALNAEGIEGTPTARSDRQAAESNLRDAVRIYAK